jgi:hypothetical protein
MTCTGPPFPDGYDSTTLILASSVPAYIYIKLYIIMVLFANRKFYK